MFKIKPNPEKKVNGQPLKIYDPVREDFLPVEGRVVPELSYWLRRLQSGEVLKVEDKEEVTSPVTLDTGSDSEPDAELEGEPQEESTQDNQPGAEGEPVSRRRGRLRKDN